MSKQYEATTGISYKSDGKYVVAAAGDPVEFDNPADAKYALERGIVKEVAGTKPSAKTSASATPRAADVPK
jgi:hypothetical protein